MKTYTQKPHESKTLAAANAVTQKQSTGKPTLQLVDNRPEAVAQRKLNNTINEANGLQTRVIQRARSTSKKKSAIKAPEITKTITKTRNKYKRGQHGFKTSEQKFLGNKFGKKVSGATHQSEHYFGFAALNQTSGKSRKESGVFERNAHAYQESYQSHRDHVGTGSSKQIGDSGFSSETYRNDSRMLLESGDVSSAGQLNTLGYAFQPNFSKQAQTTEGKQANDSFTSMINEMDNVNYMQGNTQVSVPVSKYDKLEQLAARYAVERKHNWPTQQDIADAKKALGM